MWEDGSPIDFSNWAPGQRVINASSLNDDRGHVCVEMTYDSTWRMAACSGNKRDYFVCQVKKLFAPTSSDSKHSGRTAGIVLGVLFGVAALVGFAVYIVKRTGGVPQMTSFDNPLSRGQRGTGIKPQTLNNTASNDLTNSGNDSPFGNKSLNDWKKTLNIFI